MRITVLTHGNMPFGLDYARAFAARGHQVEVLSLVPCAGDYFGVPVKAIGTVPYQPGKRSSALNYLKMVLPIRRAVRQFAPDILMAVYISSAGTIASLTGHPRIVLSAHGSDVNEHIDSPLWRALFRWQIHRSRMVHAVAEFIAESLQRRVGLGMDKTLVAPVGTDTQLFAMVDPAARPRSGRILCTRSHKPVYGQETLVRAMSRLKAQGEAFHVTFAHAVLAERTQELVRQDDVADRATFLPGYRPGELPALMAASDVYVSASLADGASVSLLEAMSTGTFPVVTDIPANRPWIQHGINGLLFPAGDDATLADCLVEALSQDHLRAAAAPINRSIVEQRGDFNRQVDRLLEAFQKLL